MDIRNLKPIKAIMPHRYLLLNIVKSKLFHKKKSLVITFYLVVVLLFAFLPGAPASVPVNTSFDNPSGVATANSSTQKDSFYPVQGAYEENSNYQSNSASDTQVEVKKYNRLIVIDAGHGGIDPGAVSGELLEKDINLDICKKIGSILEQSGFNVYLTRTDDTFMKPSVKIETANKKNASLFLSIHCNAFKDKSVDGTTTLYYPSNYSACGNLSGRDYAKIIQGELMNVIDSKSRGIIASRGLLVLKGSKMPSVLVELGYISNDSDVKLLSTDSFKTKAAQGIAEGIKKALEKVN